MKIREDDALWVAEEQLRLRRAGGRKVTHAEIFQRMRVAYEASRGGVVDLDTTEIALIRRWRQSGLDRRNKALAQLATIDQAGPEVIPARRPEPARKKNTG